MSLFNITVVDVACVISSSWKVTVNKKIGEGLEGADHVLILNRSSCILWKLLRNFNLK
jgi:hypothetical protein